MGRNVKKQPARPWPIVLALLGARVGLRITAIVCTALADGLERLDQPAAWACTYHRCGLYGGILTDAEWLRLHTGTVVCLSCLRPARAMTRAEVRAETKRPAPR